MVENNSDFLNLKLQSIPAADIAVKSPKTFNLFHKDIAVLLCMLIFEQLLLFFSTNIDTKSTKKNYQIIPKNTHFKKSFEYTKFLRHVFESFFDLFFAPFYANKTLYKLVLCVPALDVLQ